jgi:hypothetical protein
VRQDEVKQIAEIRALIKNKMPVYKACEKAGMTLARWYALNSTPVQKMEHRKLKKLARLYAASLLNQSKEIFSDDPEMQEYADQIGGYLQDIADEILKKSGHTEFCITFDECARKTVMPFQFEQVKHTKDCELGDNHKDCPACIENENGT